MRGDRAGRTSRRRAFPSHVPPGAAAGVREPKNFLGQECHRDDGMHPVTECEPAQRGRFTGVAAAGTRLFPDCRAVARTGQDQGRIPGSGRRLAPPRSYGFWGQISQSRVSALRLPAARTAETSRRRRGSRGNVDAGGCGSGGARAVVARQLCLPSTSCCPRGRGRARPASAGMAVWALPLLTGYESTLRMSVIASARLRSSCPADVVADHDQEQREPRERREREHLRQPGRLVQVHEVPEDQRGLERRRSRTRRAR